MDPCCCGIIIYIYLKKVIVVLYSWWWVGVCMGGRGRSRGGEMGEFSPPFSEPPSFFFSYLSNV